jgi:hypothetical protein
MEKGT